MSKKVHKLSKKEQCRKYGKKVHNAEINQDTSKKACQIHHHILTNRLFRKKDNKQFKMLLWREKESEVGGFAVLAGYCSRQ